MYIAYKNINMAGVFMSKIVVIKSFSHYHVIDEAWIENKINPYHETKCTKLYCYNSWNHKNLANKFLT